MHDPQSPMPGQGEGGGGVGVGVGVGEGTQPMQAPAVFSKQSSIDCSVSLFSFVSLFSVEAIASSSPSDFTNDGE